MISAALALLALSSCAAPRDPGTRPNVVLVVIDTLRPDHLSFYGYRKETAPWLAGLARRAAVFVSAYSTSSWTAPATASLFTSLQPEEHGVTQGLLAVRLLQSLGEEIDLNRIPDDCETIPAILRDAGYRTFGVSDNMNVRPEEGFARGFDRFDFFDYEGAERVAAAAIARRDEILGNGAPYFLYLHFMDPHKDYNRRAPWYTGDRDGVIDTLAAYDSEIAFVDEKLGELAEAFGWDEETMIVFTSDHGEEFGEHGEFGHGRNLYRETLAIPMMFHWPGGGIAPARVAHEAGIIDVLPTLRGLLALEPSDQDRGHDWSGALANAPGKETGRPAARSLFAHLWRTSDTRDKGDDIVMRSVVRDSWHYIWTLPGREELYAMEHDPGETVDRSSTEIDRMRGMREEYLYYEERARSWSSSPNPFRVSREMAERLKALGYLD